jgi:nicotinamide-nucleotide amidase
MFQASMVPMLKQRLPLSETYVCRVFKTTGLGESWVEQKIASPLRHLIETGLDLGYCARIGEVEVRIAARGLRAEETVAEAELIIRKQIGPEIFGCDDDTLESAVVRLLTSRQETLALAESCTGGFIAHRITNVPGASAALMCGWVSYANSANQEFLGVEPASIARHGAVSEVVARQMAEGARSRSGATYALAVTGIAGPGGGSTEKPVGTVYIGLAEPGGTNVVQQLNAYDRETFKYVTSQQALDLLRRKVEPPDQTGRT